MSVPEPLSDRAAATREGRFHFNASAIALGGQGALILGAPAAGKSTLALSLLALGAELIADDGVWTATGPNGPVLIRPDGAPAMIEARGIGLLHAGPIMQHAPLALVVDLDAPEPDRLPPLRSASLGPFNIALIRAKGHPQPAPAVAQLLRFGRVAV
jgi:serine kinase of HPr protein (carbohydrate metabolism regulator)